MMLAAPVPSAPAPDPQADVYRRILDKLIAGEDYPLSTSEVQELQLYGFLGWRQPSVVAALEGFESGSMQWPHQMWIAMLRDEMVSHGVETRVNGIVQTEFEWVKPDGLPQALFDEWVARWPEVWSEDELASSTRHRIGLGIVPAQVIWTAGDDQFWPRKIAVKDTGNMAWYPTERRFKIVTLDRGQQTIEDDADPWILFRERAASYPYLYAAARSLAGPWWLKQEMAALEGVYGRICGTPVKKVTTPVEQRSPTEGAPDSKLLLQRVERLLGGGVFQALAFPPDFKAGWNFNWEEVRGDAHKVFDTVIDRSDTYITLKLLGAINNTRNAEHGNLSTAKVHQQQTNKYLSADCTLTARVLSRIARKWSQFNRIPMALAPVPVFHHEPPEDQSELAETAQKYAAGVKAFADANGAPPPGADLKATAERCGWVFPAGPGEQQVGLTAKQ